MCEKARLRLVILISRAASSIQNGPLRRTGELIEVKMNGLELWVVIAPF